MSKLTEQVIRDYYRQAIQNYSQDNIIEDLANAWNAVEDIDRRKMYLKNGNKIDALAGYAQENGFIMGFVFAMKLAGAERIGEAV